MIGPITKVLGRKKLIVLSFLIMGLTCLLYERTKPLGTSLIYICLILVRRDLRLHPGWSRRKHFRWFIEALSLESVCNARVGGILSPPISSLPKGSFMCIFGGLGIGSALITSLLAEAEGGLMVDTVGKKKKHFTV